MKCASAVLLLTLCVVGAQGQTRNQQNGQSTDVAGALSRNNLTLAAALLDIANVTKPASNPDARATFLLPTDAAIRAFLRDMNLTVDELKQRPLLAKQLVAQHTLLGEDVLGANIFEQGEQSRNVSTMATTKARGDDLEFKRSGGGVRVTGPQNVTANVGTAFELDSNKRVLPIDRVLMGDAYYMSFDAMCRHRFWRVSVFCYAVEYVGLTPMLQPKKGLDATVYVPNNDAFSKAIAKGIPSREDLVETLKYHVVPGAKELPIDLKTNSSSKTLQGRNITVTYTRPSRNSRNSSEAGEGAYDWVFINVIPAAGEPVSVMKANVHVGKAIVHGIGSVLAFNATSATDLVKNGSNTSTMAADMVPLNVLSVSPNATSTGPRSSTAGSGRMAIPTANLAAATTTDTGGNRKLLQSASGGGGSTGSQDGPTIAGNQASSDIRNAVFGNTRVRTATNRGVAIAEETDIDSGFEDNEVDGWK